jgi:hypothetical protein
MVNVGLIWGWRSRSAGRGPIFLLRHVAHLEQFTALIEQRDSAVISDVQANDANWGLILASRQKA